MPLLVHFRREYLKQISKTAKLNAVFWKIIFVFQDTSFSCAVLNQFSSVQLSASVKCVIMWINQLLVELHSKAETLLKKNMNGVWYICGIVSPAEPKWKSLRKLCDHSNKWFLPEIAKMHLMDKRTTIGNGSCW